MELDRKLFADLLSSILHGHTKGCWFTCGHLWVVWHLSLSLLIPWTNALNEFIPSSLEAIFFFHFEEEPYPSIVTTLGWLIRWWRCITPCLGSEGSIMSWEARVRLCFPQQSVMPLTATPSSIRKALLLFLYCGARACYIVCNSSSRKETRCPKFTSPFAFLPP